MKFKIDVDVDYTFDQKLDEKLDDEIVRGVVDHVASAAMESIDLKAVIEMAKTKIDSGVTEMLDTFLSKEVILKDNFGDTTGVYSSVKDMLKEKFDNYIEALVDKSGNQPAGCTYGDKKPRIDYILEKHMAINKKEILSILDRKASACAEEVKKIAEGIVADMLTAKLKTNIAKGLVEKIDIPGMLGAKEV